MRGKKVGEEEERRRRIILAGDWKKLSQKHYRVIEERGSSKE